MTISEATITAIQKYKARADAAVDSGRLSTAIEELAAESKQMIEAARYVVGVSGGDVWPAVLLALHLGREIQKLIPCQLRTPILPSEERPS